MSFLEKYDLNYIPLTLEVGELKPINLFLGEGSQPLEIAVFSSYKKPTSAKVQEAFRKRRARRAAAVLIVITHPEGVTVCGTSGEQPPIYYLKDKNQVERLCAITLKKSNKNESIKFLAEAIPSLETNLPGIINEGFLSNHELEVGVQKRKDWELALIKSKKIIEKSSKNLFNSLGFISETLDNLTEILIANGENIGIAVTLNKGELPQISNDRFNNISPISYALTKAQKIKVSWILIYFRNGVRLYSSKNIGIAKRSRSETFIECQPYLLSSQNRGLLWLLFSSEALKQKGTIYSILENSQRFSIDVAEKLRERIYEKVVPLLAMSIARERKLLSPNREELSITYQMAVTVLFRLLFISYAEDRDFLPYKSNEKYRQISLKEKAKELVKKISNNEPSNTGFEDWIKSFQLCEAISRGNKELSIPAYGGTIFSNDIDISKPGAFLSKVKIKNEIFDEILTNLLLTTTAEGNFVPIDFRSLSVREFGTIYEGLLESELSVAEENLSITSDGSYKPTKGKDTIKIKKGDIYLHDQSGARKSSGSYFTPEFLVNYILDKTLEPAIDNHLENLIYLNEAERAEQFFNFHVADIAMGSGHFLVAAIDRIENRFSNWLEENKTPAIIRELEFLKASAKNALGEFAETIEIDDNQLLRRMIARRCIYGSDLNPITVQLSQLSIWIHTFVPGLPLFLLDHNLINGNALIGVDSLDQIKKALNQDKGTLFEINADEILYKAAEPLRRLARLSDSSIQDIEAGRSLMEEAKKNVKEIESLCDIITSKPLSKDPSLSGYIFSKFSLKNEDSETNQAINIAKNILNKIKPIHFPIVFPEVFLSQKGGFNVILGNPPWKEVVINEDKFWARYNPGLTGLSAGKQTFLIEEFRKNRPDLFKELKQELHEAKLIREFLHAGNFPGMSTGDPDLYKAFLWRFWYLSAKSNGRIGIVFPRTGLSAKGSEKFRRNLFASADSIDITTLNNKGYWVFDIEARYTIAVAAISKNSKKELKGISLKGPFDNFEDFANEKDNKSLIFDIEEVLNWNESVSLPLLPTTFSSEVFAQLRKSPWLNLNNPGEWRARPDGELHATAQKPLMDYSEKCPTGFWPVYKGLSFNLWEPDTKDYNSWADPEKVLPWIQDKRSRANKSSRESVHKEFSPEFINDIQTLSPNSARIVFRDVTNRTNSRTVIACLIPPKTFVTNKAPIIMFPRGDKKDEAYLLGILCSIPLDWYARRFVETNLNFFILNPFPIPRPDRTNKFWIKIVKLAGRLACPDERFKKWAQEVGVDYGPLQSEIKDKMIYELDAVVAHLYGLNEKQLIHIFETFHKGWDYDERLKEVLKFFHEHKK